MLYFAYGSSMDWAQMRKRCPSACFMGIAMFPEHRLAFIRKSIARGCGVAGMVRAASDQIWEAVFGISDLDLGLLDKSEGYRPGRDRNSYVRRECMVFFDGEEGRRLTFATYFAERQPNPPLPNQEYKNRLLVGAKYWRVPAACIAELERIRVQG